MNHQGGKEKDSSLRAHRRSPHYPARDWKRNCEEGKVAIFSCPARCISPTVAAAAIPREGSEVSQPWKARAQRILGIFVTRPVRSDTLRAGPSRGPRSSSRLANADIRFKIERGF